MAFKCETELPHLWERYINDINNQEEEPWMKLAALPSALVFQWETNHKRFGLSCEAEVSIIEQKQNHILVEVVDVGNSLMNPEKITKTKTRKRVKWPMKELDPIEFL